MAPYSLIATPIFSLFVTMSLVACGQVSDKISANKNQLNPDSNLKFDTSRTAIIEFRKSRWPFDSTFQPAALTQSELQTVDSFFLVCVTDYNTSLDKEHKQWGIDLKKNNYRKQLIVVTNKKGEKEVWVNCFCVTDDYDWKKKVFVVDDGGNCFFNFKINLTIHKYYDLMVNGVA